MRDEDFVATGLQFNATDSSRTRVQTGLPATIACLSFLAPKRDSDDLPGKPQIKPVTAIGQFVRVRTIARSLLRVPFAMALKSRVRLAANWPATCTNKELRTRNLRIAQGRGSP